MLEEWLDKYGKPPIFWRFQWIWGCPFRFVKYHYHKWCGRFLLATERSRCVNSVVKGAEWAWSLQNLRFSFSEKEIKCVHSVSFLDTWFRSWNWRCNNRSWRNGQLLDCDKHYFPPRFICSAYFSIVLRSSWYELKLGMPISREDSEVEEAAASNDPLICDGMVFIPLLPIFGGLYLLVHNRIRHNEREAFE